MTRKNPNPPKMLMLPASAKARAVADPRPSFLDAAATPAQWLGPEGAPVTCEEKIKILNENLAEIRALCAEALHDAALMGCSEQFARDVFLDAIAALPSPSKK